MFHRLLIPLDGSDAAKVALVYAEAIPSERVRLLTVLSDEDAGIGFAPSDLQREWRQEWQDSIGARLEELAEPLRARGRKIEAEVVFGSPAEWIETYSEDADLIIMTTHGRGGGERVFYGSVADRIARSAKTPVMLIRGGEDPIAAQAIVRLVIGVDGSELSEQSLPLAGQLAKELDVPVLLVRVVDFQQAALAAQLSATPSARYAGSPDTVRESVETYLESLAGEFRKLGVEVETAVIDGSPALALHETTLPGDVLVLTSHGRGGLGRWMLGSVTEKLVREGSTPVVVVRSQVAAES